MRLFGLGGAGEPESAEARQRQEASLRNLEQGGLPLNAVDRLREQASRQGTPGHIFTSDLSVNELMAVKQAGYEPLGQVMGSSMYHVGWQYVPNSGYSWSANSGELAVLTQAFYHARHLALGRLEQEAALLGATGVVGVRLERREYEWGQHMLEFTAIGTAIREHDVPPGKLPGARPFLSDISGEEFWTLRQSGFRPVGIAVGNCTYYCVPTWRTQSATMGGFFGSAWQNQELTDFTQGIYSARSLAMDRMEEEGRTIQADGIVGADVEVQAEPHEVEISENQKRLDMIFHFTCIGTAIAPYAGRWPVFSVQNVVPLT